MRADISIDFSDIKRECFEKLCANAINKLDEMDEFFKVTEYQIFRKKIIPVLHKVQKIDEEDILLNAFDKATITHQNQENYSLISFKNIYMKF
jgi:hypothetical protein